MNRLILISTILLLLSLPCSSRPQGIWKTYTRADGLAGDTVYCINQDKFGNMWFGTWGAGLSKLDTNGVWTNFMNKDSTVYILDIEVDSLNNKWLTIALNGGVLFGQYVGKFSDTTVVAFYDLSKSSMARPVCLGQDSLGQIWCGMSDYGLAYWFDGTEWQPYVVIGTGIYSQVNEIKTDHRGKLYFAHSRGISTLTDYPFYGPLVHNLAFDKQNRMWFTAGSNWWDLVMFDGKNFHNFISGQGNYPYAIAIDSSNNVWFSYSDRAAGVSKFDGTKFTYFNHNDGLGADLVYNIFVDKDGNIWFATFGGGVSVLRDTTKTKIHQTTTSNSDPATFSLVQNYPNPFNNSTLIKYFLSRCGKVEFSIYNLTGKEVMQLVNENQSAGFHYVFWDGKDKYEKEVSSGIYIAVLKFNDLNKSIKLSIIR